MNGWVQNWVQGEMSVNNTIKLEWFSSATMNASVQHWVKANNVVTTHKIRIVHKRCIIFSIQCSISRTSCSFGNNLFFFIDSLSISDDQLTQEHGVGVGIFMAGATCTDFRDLLKECVQYFLRCYGLPKAKISLAVV